MPRAGIIGVGFMGMIHYLAAQRVPGLTIGAIATRDPVKRSGDWTSIRGNFGPPGAHMDLTGVSTYATAEELLADPTLDWIDICLPNDLHTEVTVAALSAGKNVLVEKPIALTLAEADRMLESAKKSGRRLLVAHVLPFFPEFAFAAQAVRLGKFGRLLAGQFRRHISPPDWSAAIGDLARSGGPIIDLHIHDTHFVCNLAGAPRAVTSTGRVRSETVEYVSTVYHYPPDGPVLSATSGSISHSTRPFTHGFELIFEQATLSLEGGQPLTLFSDSGVTQPVLGSSDPIDCFAAELQHADAVFRGVAEPGLLAPEHARDGLELCLAEQRSVLTGTSIVLRN